METDLTNTRDEKCLNSSAKCATEQSIYQLKRRNDVIVNDINQSVPNDDVIFNGVNPSTTDNDVIVNGVHQSKTDNDGITSGVNQSTKDISNVSCAPAQTVHPSISNVPVLEMSSQRMFKNVIVICLVFFLNFLAYNGLAALQSSLHVQQGMGVITQAVLYVTTAMSSLLLPKMVIRILGHKWCMSVSLCGYILWMAANGYAVWGTMVPASVLVGICASTLWTAHGSYLTIIAHKYAEMTQEATSTVMARFFGLFFATYRLSSVFGNVVSSTVLSQRPVNFTTPDESELRMTCGLNDCPNYNRTNANLERPSTTTLWTLVGVYISIGVIAIIISCLFIDNIPVSWQKTEQSPDTSSSVCTRQLALSSLFATAAQMRHVKQLLLLPLTMYTGLEETFQDAEYSKSFVSCFLGLWMIGYCAIPQSLTNAISSLCSGRLMKFTGILPVCLFGTAMTAVYLLSLLFWQPSLDLQVLFYVIPCFNSIADAIFVVQITAVSGLLFPTNSEATFANYKLWQSIGRIQAFAYSSLLCTSVKLYILIAFFIVGITTFLTVYFCFIRTKNNSIDSLEKNVTSEKRNEQKDDHKSES